MQEGRLDIAFDNGVFLQMDSLGRRHFAFDAAGNLNIVAGYGGIHHRLVADLKDAPDLKRPLKLPVDAQVHGLFERKTALHS